MAFLARHGAGHRLLPSELNFRANIFGMKMLGVEYILSASAVGSLKEEYKPLDIVVPDQFIDRTKGRVSTFFGRGLAAHVGFAHPFCKKLSAVAVGSGRRVGATVHEGGTYVCMEGPQHNMQCFLEFRYSIRPLQSCHLQLFLAVTNGHAQGESAMRQMIKGGNIFRHFHGIEEG